MGEIQGPMSFVINTRWRVTIRFSGNMVKFLELSNPGLHETMTEISKEDVEIFTHQGEEIEFYRGINHFERCFQIIKSFGKELHVTALYSIFFLPVHMYFSDSSKDSYYVWIFLAIALIFSCIVGYIVCRVLFIKISKQRQLYVNEFRVRIGRKPEFVRWRDILFW
jgi:hypothetical protein